MSYHRTVLFDHVAGGRDPVAICVFFDPRQGRRLGLEFDSADDPTYSLYLEPAGSIEFARCLKASLEHGINVQLPAVGMDGHVCALIVCSDPNRYVQYTPFNVSHHQALVVLDVGGLIHPAVCTVSEIVELHNAVADSHNYLVR